MNSAAEEEKASFRQRGWSVATDGTHESSVLDEDTKQQLLNTMPHSLSEEEDEEDMHHQDEGLKQFTVSSKRTSSDMSGSSSDMFGSDDEDDSNDEDDDKEDDKNTEHQQARKRKATEDDDNDDNDKNGNYPAKRSRREIQQLAQRHLSKWAARLFEPDRPKGLVQPPEVIPLNDEFLRAFGQREKAFDKARGLHDLEIDRAIRDQDEDDDDGNRFDPTAKPSAVANPTLSNEKDKKETVTVKISNLKFTTTQKDLLKACHAFGAVTEINLLMEDEVVEEASSSSSNNNNNNNGNATPRNRGRAYVVFDSEEGAQACMDGFTELDGRPLRVERANPTGSSGGGGRTSLGGFHHSLSRYYETDISTKCYRCGEVGHREAECINPAKARPCPICAGIDHELRNCPLRAVCFNCGIPGHVARNCSQPRGMPPRTICTVCFQTGHTKYDCRQSYRDAANLSQDAICMVCGGKGHNLCQELQWFHSVAGVSCCNCGQSGHIGRECMRPNYETLSRDEGLAKIQVERIQEDENSSSNNNNTNNNNAGRRRGRQQESMDFQTKRRRVQSLPPMPSSRNLDQSARRNNHNHSQYRPQEPRGRR